MRGAPQYSICGEEPGRAAQVQIPRPLRCHRHPRLAEGECAVILGENAFHYFAGDIGEAEVAALVAIG